MCSRAELCWVPQHALFVELLALVHVALFIITFPDAFAELEVAVKQSDLRRPRKWGCVVAVCCVHTNGSCFQFGSEILEQAALPASQCYLEMNIYYGIKDKLSAS